MENLPEKYIQPGDIIRFVMNPGESPVVFEGKYMGKEMYQPKDFAERSFGDAYMALKFYETEMQTFVYAPEPICSEDMKTIFVDTKDSHDL